MKRLLIILLSFTFTQDYSLQFDGNDLVTINSTFNELINEDFSISLWVALDYSFSWEGIINKGYNPNGGVGFALRRENANNTIFLSSGGGCHIIGTLNPVLGNDDNIFTNIILIRNNNEYDFYLDGEENTHPISDECDMVIWDNNSLLEFGTGNGDSEKLNGKLDEIAIWNTALEESDVNIVFNSGVLSLPDNNLIAYYNFNEGLGDTLYDNSENENHGIISGATWVCNNDMDLCGVCGGDNSSCTTITDIDDNLYGTVQIGEQLWMRQNLKVTHYNDGSEILSGYNDGEWQGLTTGAFAIYNNEPSNAEIYGNLYNWYAVDDDKDICPENWHVPNDDEYRELEIFLGMSESDADGTGWRGTNEGGKLKEEGTIHWNPPNLNATNETGFTGLPGGYKDENGNFGDISLQGYFWTSTDYNDAMAWGRNLSSENAQIRRYGEWYNNHGYSMRCIETVLGCTDSFACNEDPEANVDDGSCEYTCRDNGDYSLSFDGDDDYVFIDISENYAFGTGDFSWSIWLFVDQYDTYWHTFSVNGSQDQGALKIAWEGEDAGKVYYYSAFTGPTLGCIPSAIITPGEWTYLVLVRESNIAKIYIDGESQGSCSFLDTFEAHSIKLGHGCCDEYSDGKMDQVSIWNIALTNEQIQSYHEIPPIGNEEGLVSYWKFNAGIGDILYDHSGNQNHGILMNMDESNWILNNDPPECESIDDIIIQPPTDCILGIEPETVELCATVTDPDGDDEDLSIQWFTCDGELLGAGQCISLELEGVGEHCFYYIATDLYGDSCSEEYNINIEEEPHEPPNCYAGDDVTITIPHDGTPATNTAWFETCGEAVDIYGCDLTYQWSDCSGNVIADSSCFGIELEAGSYCFQFSAENPYGDNCTDDIIVTVLEEQNEFPICTEFIDFPDILAVPHDGEPGGSVTYPFCYDATDHNGDALSYTWQINGENFNGECIEVSFTPDIYAIDVFVSDPYPDSFCTDNDSLTVLPEYNSAPVAVADYEETYYTPDVIMDAYDSYDPDLEDYINVKWFNDSDDLIGTGFTLSISGLLPGEYNYTLVVTDSYEAAGTTYFSISVCTPLLSLEPESIDEEIQFATAGTFVVDIINNGTCDYEILDFTYPELDLCNFALIDSSSINIICTADTTEASYEEFITIETTDPYNSTFTTPFSIHIVPNEHPIITSIDDVPEDQGGWVWANFTRSYHDTDTLRSVESYTVEILNEDAWGSVGNTNAYGNNYYSVLIHTTIDSSSTSDGLIDFRVIAGMEEGNFVSVVVQGYSVDNIEPTVPDDLTGTYSDGEVNLEWSVPVDEDFDYFSIYRNEDLISASTESNFTDSDYPQDAISVNYYIQSFDIHGNGSEPSESLELINFQINDLHAGANLNSFYAFPEDNSVANMMSDLECNVTGVIGEGVAASNICTDGNPTWVGSLAELSPTSGYWIKLNEQDILDIPGCSQTNPATVFNFHVGANLTSYPIPDPNDISDALPDDVEPLFTGIIGEGVAASHLGGGVWVGSLAEFTGTKGYWAKVSEALSFSFIPPEGDLVREPQNTLPESPYEYIQSIYQAFYFIEEATIDGEPLEIGDWIIAYNEDIVVGARQWTGAYTDIPAMGYYDESTLGYCEAGDIPRFVVEKGLTGEVYELNGTIPVWENNMLFYMTLQGSTVHVPTEFEVSVAYPNPFNPRTSIKYGLPVDNFVSIVVYDLSGKQVANLMNGQQAAGFHSVTWDAQNQSSGLYFVKLVTQDYQNTQKVMLVK